MGSCEIYNHGRKNKSSDSATTIFIRNDNGCCLRGYTIYQYVKGNKENPSDIKPEGLCAEIISAVRMLIS